MEFKEFLKLAYPEELARAEKSKDILFKTHRWLGLRAAFVFYQIGLSANFLSIMRALIAFVGLYFISSISQGKILVPLIGTMLLYGQYILDQADGPIARASNKVSKLGAELDDLATDAARLTILVIGAALSRNIVLIAFSAFIGYLAVTFRNKLITAGIAYDSQAQGLALLFRIIFSAHMMLFVLPLTLILGVFLNLEMAVLSYAITGFYSVAVFLWSLPLVYKK